MSSRIVSRALVLAVALVAVAWLVAGLRSSEAESDGLEVVNAAGRGTPSEEVARGLESLRDARSLNPGKDPEVNEVILLSISGAADRSVALAERVVTEEPDNVGTWFALWAAAVAADDRERADRALAEVRSLDPLRARVLERLDPQASS